MERYSTPVVQHICLSTNIFSKSKEELLAVFGDNERNQVNSIVGSVIR